MDTGKGIQTPSNLVLIAFTVQNTPLKATEEVATKFNNIWSLKNKESGVFMDIHLKVKPRLLAATRWKITCTNYTSANQQKAIMCKLHCIYESKQSRNAPNWCQWKYIGQPTRPMIVSWTNAKRITIEKSELYHLRTKIGASQKKERNTHQKK